MTKFTKKEVQAILLKDMKNNNIKLFSNGRINVKEYLENNWTLDDLQGILAILGCSLFFGVVLGICVA